MVAQFSTGILAHFSISIYITKEEADDIQDAEYEEIIDKSAKSNKLAEIAAKAAGVKDQPRPEQPTDQTQDYANNKPTRKSLL